MNATAAITIDAIVLFAYFAGIVGIGLYAGRKNTDLKDFALGGRNIPWWAVLASIIAAETSAATFLGTPAEGFKTRGFIYGQLVIGTILARIVIALTFIEPYYRYRVQSIYEFLTVRFGTRTKNMASGIFLLTRVLGIGVRLYLGGVIMVVIWRFFFPGAPTTIWTYFGGILAITVITTLYTAIGGIKAVVWTDLIQAILMIGSVIFAIMLLLGRVGGLGAVETAVGGWDKIQWVQTGWNTDLPFWAAFRGMLAEPYTLFAAFIGSTFLTMATHGTDQDMVQRMLTAPDYRKSRFSLILSGLADIPIVICFLSVGILLWVYYTQHGMPQVGGSDIADNEMFAHFIVNDMPVGLRGLIIAGVFATMMGSTSAALNALATSFTKDFYLPYFNKNATDRESIFAARVATMIFGILMIIVATISAGLVIKDPHLTIIPIALGVMGYTYGALLGVFLIGMLTRTRGRDATNILAMILGMIAVLVLCRVELPAFGKDPKDVVVTEQAVSERAAVISQELADLGKTTTPEQVRVTAEAELRDEGAKWRFGWFLPRWWPQIAWSWFVLVGASVTFTFGALFRTPASQVRIAEEHIAEQARSTTEYRMEH
ncbi:MAG: sodium:solute symporter [Chthoniobacteraceae bacterium]